MTILSTKCPHCQTSNIALLVVGSASSAEVNIRSAFLRCPKCKMPSVARLQATQSAAFVGYTGPEEGTGIEIRSTDFADGGELTSSGWNLIDLWPEPPQPLIPDHLPEQVRRALRQAETNFHMPDMEDPAAGSYGRALDIATKVMVPDFKGLLFKRIEYLAEEGRITKELAGWAHEIRSIRNDALHEPEGIDREELVAIRGFTDMVLRYLFTLPGMLAERKATT